MIGRYGDETEIEEAKERMTEIMGKTTAREAKRHGSSSDGNSQRSKKQELEYRSGVREVISVLSRYIGRGLCRLPALLLKLKLFPTTSHIYRDRLLRIVRGRFSQPESLGVDSGRRTFHWGSLPARSSLPIVGFTGYKSPHTRRNIPHPRRTGQSCSSSRLA